MPKLYALATSRVSDKEAGPLLKYFGKTIEHLKKNSRKVAKVIIKAPASRQQIHMQLSLLSLLFLPPQLRLNTPSPLFTKLADIWSP
jgi:hypothetical protein